VGIEDAHAEISFTRRFEHDELVAADPGVTVGEGSGKPGIDLRQSSLAPIEHDEIVAQSVHLGEFDPHGARSRSCRPPGPVLSWLTGGLPVPCPRCSARGACLSAPTSLTPPAQA